MNLLRLWDLYENPVMAQCASQYVHPTVTQVARNFSHGQKWPEFDPKFSTFVVLFGNIFKIFENVKGLSIP